MLILGRIKFVGKTLVSKQSIFLRKTSRNLQVEILIPWIWNIPSHEFEIVSFDLFLLVFKEHPVRDLLFLSSFDWLRDLNCWEWLLALFALHYYWACNLDKWNRIGFFLLSLWFWCWHVVRMVQSNLGSKGIRLRHIQNKAFLIYWPDHTSWSKMLMHLFLPLDDLWRPSLLQPSETHSRYDLINCVFFPILFIEIIRVISVLLWLLVIEELVGCDAKNSFLRQFLWNLELFEIKHKLFTHFLRLDLNRLRIRLYLCLCILYSCLKRLWNNDH